MKRKQEIEIIDIPKRFVRLARERTRPMVRHWAETDSDSLADLVTAVYLQGVYDGFQTAEKGKCEKV